MTAFEHMKYIKNMFLFSLQLVQITYILSQPNLNELNIWFMQNNASISNLNVY